MSNESVTEWHSIDIVCYIYIVTEWHSIRMALCIYHLTAVRLLCDSIYGRVTQGLGLGLGFSVTPSMGK